MSGIDRRGFLKGLAAAGIGTVVTPQPGVGAVARADVVWKQAPCTLCAVGCGLLVGIENGRAVAVRGDPDSAVSRGLACAKGYHAVQMLYGRDRLVRARVRRGVTLVDAPLDDALDTVARALRDTLDAHGADSVAVFGSSQWTDADAAAAAAFCRAVGTEWLDTETSLYSASAAAGRSGSLGPTDAGDTSSLEDADVFVLWNHNMAETDPVLFSRLLARRRTDAGVRIIDVTTRTARTSYAADRSLIYAPGTELTLLNAICAELIRRRLIDRTFVDAGVTIRRGRTQLGDGLRGVAEEEAADASFADLVRFLEPYTPERAQQVTGIPAADVRWLAEQYGNRARRVTSLWGDGVNGHVRGTWVNNALHNVHLLTGRTGAGNAALSLSGRAPVDAGPGRGPLSMFRRLDEGALRFLWVQSADPMLTLPNLRRYRRAASRDDVFIVVSDAYPTATTDIANVVLPSALWIERTGSRMNAQGGAQALGGLLRAPGDALGEARQLAEVARRAGRAIVPAELAPASTPAATPDSAGRATVWLRPQEAGTETTDRQYPFTLHTGAVLEHAAVAALTRRVPALHRAMPRAYVELHHDDARDLGVRTGERVRLVSRRGSLELEARVDLRSQPARGQLFVPRFDEAHPINLLTLDTCCPLSGQPDYGAAIRIERITRMTRS
jgi:nitrate reductase NapA